MNQISYVLILLIAVSCTQERAITKTPEKDFFKKNETNNSNYISGVSVSESNPSGGVQGRVSSQTLFVTELKNNSIPHSLPNNDFPDWKSFNTFYESKKNGLSGSAKQYCTELLLKSYDLTQYSSPVVKNVISESMALLSENNYAGYELLHKYLSWMKVNNVEFKPIQSKILSYAKPILGKPDPNLKDDPIFESNPEFKKNMEKLVEKAKMNDTFIDKIRSL